MVNKFCECCDDVDPPPVDCSGGCEGSFSAPGCFFDGVCPRTAVVREYRFSITGLTSSSGISCTDINGTHIVEWQGGCLWNCIFRPGSGDYMIEFLLQPNSTGNGAELLIRYDYEISSTGETYQTIARYVDTGFQPTEPSNSFTLAHSTGDCSSWPDPLSVDSLCQSTDPCPIEETYSDSTFNTADWSITNLEPVLTEITSSTFQKVSSHSTQSEPPGTSSWPAAQLNVTIGGHATAVGSAEEDYWPESFSARQEIFAAVFMNNFAYDPSSHTNGAINALDIQWYQRLVTNPADSHSAAEWELVPAVQQGGETYVCTALGLGMSLGIPYLRCLTALTESDFHHMRSAWDTNGELYPFTIDSTRHPDFSASGGSISFGFAIGKFDALDCFNCGIVDGDGQQCDYEDVLPGESYTCEVLLNDVVWGVNEGLFIYDYKDLPRFELTVPSHPTSESLGLVGDNNETFASDYEGVFTLEPMENNTKWSTDITVSKNAPTVLASVVNHRISLELSPADTSGEGFVVLDVGFRWKGESGFFVNAFPDTGGAPCVYNNGEGLCFWGADPNRITRPIAVDATAAEVAAELEHLWQVGTVTGISGTWPSAVVVEFEDIPKNRWRREYMLGHTNDCSHLEMDLGYFDESCIYVRGRPTSGHFTLIHDGNETSNIAWNAAGQSIISALKALPSIGNNDIQLGPGVPPFALFEAGPNHMEFLSFTGTKLGDPLTEITLGANTLAGTPYDISVNIFQPYDSDQAFEGYVDITTDTDPTPKRERRNCWEMTQRRTEAANLGIYLRCNPTASTVSNIQFQSGYSAGSGALNLYGDNSFSPVVWNPQSTQYTALQYRSQDFDWDSTESVDVKALDA